MLPAGARVGDAVGVGLDREELADVVLVVVGALRVDQPGAALAPLAGRVHRAPSSRRSPPA